MYIDNAKAIHWDRVPASTASREAIDCLLESLEASEQRSRARRRSDRDRLAQTLGAFALELYVARRDSGDGWRRYSRAKAAYSGKSRYDASPVSHTAACTVADWLIAAGFAEGILGHYVRIPEFGENVGAGQQSRIRATDQLVAWLEGKYGVSPRDVGFAPWSEPIILRGPATDRSGIKPVIDYADSAETVQMRSNLRRINKHLSKFRLTLIKAEGGVEELPPFSLRRIFNNGSFEFGGRFYRAPWINMPSAERAALLIDGEEVVELDFSALHPRLIYQLECRPLAPEIDPYALVDWDGRVNRGWVKKAFQQLLNSEDGGSLHRPKGVPKKLVSDSGWRKLLADLQEHHQAIANWFRSGRGVELQRIDSEVAEETLLAMCDQGVCCLPVHDSFIVPETHESSLRLAMTDAYLKVLGRRGYEARRPVIR